MAIKTLQDALKECLREGHKASYYEAKVVREIILADGQVSAQERILLEEALHKNNFDDKAVSLLAKLLLRADCSATAENNEGKGNCC